MTSQSGSSGPGERSSAPSSFDDNPASNEELIAQIEQTYRELGEEVRLLRERAAHQAIEDLPDDLEAVRGRWGQLTDVLRDLRAARRAEPREA